MDILNSFNDMISNISKIAKEKKKINSEVIDASIGMLYDEEGKLGEIKLISEELKTQIDSNSREYDSFTGNKSFNNWMKEWVFDDVKLDCYVGCGYTMGATGALSFSLASYCNKESTLLVPSIRWGNYDCMTSFYGIKTLEYLMFDKDNHFNLFDLEYKIKKLMDEQDNVQVLINDPCHNPTGYSMSLEEWEDLLDYLYKISYSVPITIILDIAYIDYSNFNFGKVFKKISKVINKNLHFLICFSFSKSFNLYGYRGGNIFYLCKFEEELQSFEHKLKIFCRSIWSSSNHLLTNTFSSLFQSQRNKAIVRQQINNYRDLIKQRAEIFLKECKEINLDIFPYVEGFFVLVKCILPIKAAQKLMERNIFVIPFKDGLRISIASLPIKHIKGLASEIEYVINIT